MDAATVEEVNVEMLAVEGDVVGKAEISRNLFEQVERKVNLVEQVEKIRDDLIIHPR